MIQKRPVGSISRMGATSRNDTARQERRRMRKSREYKRLHAMVPSIATTPKVSKVTVIEEAIRYIDHLHSALVTRLRTRGLPKGLREANINVSESSEEEIRQSLRQWFSASRQQQQTTHDVGHQAPTQEQTIDATATGKLEKTRTKPSYLHDKRKRPKP